ncbi:MAG: DUF2974 domain-containing protein [Oscillospiraceae bacterium]|nr:DUF2974 domain-containing protein [Oscillospiraceae bacterium]
MPNIFEYLHWRGDVPLAVAPFNHVDNLILSELVYTDFDRVVPNDGTAVPLSEARKRFFALHNRLEVQARTAHSYTAPAPFLMDSMQEGARFRDLRLCCYEAVTDLDAAAQFAAVTFLLPDNTAYVAFRGTDGTVVGWKEDMILSYRSNTVGQLCAQDYLSRIGVLTRLPLRVGGHSKGGNLAIYAAAHCAPELQERLLCVWSNDGPGFRDDVRILEGYQRIQEKCVSIVPATSVIGMLLECDCERRVVKSAASGLAEHDGFSWECGPLDFIPASPSRRGAYYGKTLDNWVARQDDATLRSLVDSLFSLFEATGEQTFHSMTTKKRRTAELMVSALRALPREKQRELLAATGRLVQSTGASARMMLEKDPSAEE